MEIDLAWADGLLALPDERPPTSAVLVLSGSSGRIERERARLLARSGAAALTFRWFGGIGQPPGVCEVPLETFLPALDQLADLSDRVVVLGVSKSAEAALLLAARDSRIAAVVGLSPTSMVWANVGPGPRRSRSAAAFVLDVARTPAPIRPLRRQLAVRRRPAELPGLV